jgi:arylsulfatase A-like enzyme
MYEASARVPLIIAGPGVRAGAVNTNVTSLLDVYPTLVDMVGGVNPSYLDGHSLAPLLVAPEDTHHSGSHPNPETRGLHLRRAAASSVAAATARPDFVVSQYHSK